MTTPKEPHFLATDMSGYRQATTAAEYERLFASAAPQQWSRGESSVFYLYSRTAAKNARQYVPFARIIIMLRNPVHLVESLHAQLVYSRDEDQTDFAAAWRLIQARKNGYRLPPQCRDPKVLWYDEVAKLGEQVARWQQHYPSSRIKFVNFDDFTCDTANVYRDILDFLELPDDGRTSFERFNARKSQRSSLIADFTERTPRWLAAVAGRTKSLLGIRRWGILDMLRRWNVRPTETKPISSSLRAEIRAAYADDVERLSHRVGRDFMAWIYPQPMGDDSEMGTRTVSAT